MKLYSLRGKNKHDIDVSLQLIWPNKNGESGEHYDFKIIRRHFVPHGKKDERYIDVKATTARANTDFFVSAPEWQVMFKFGNRYRIFRVYRTGTAEAEIRKIKDPAKLIKAGDLVPTEARFTT